ncbi:MAG: flagellar export chaperone FlgN [Balneolales bacterium]
MISDQRMTKHLVDSLQDLCSDYKETKVLLDEQIRAIINNDLNWLNGLIDQQTQKYQNIRRAEEEFKDHLVNFFQAYYPDITHPSLTKLVEVIEEPTEEIDQLRGELHEQIEKTERIRLQLVDLLTFASDHNSKTISTLSEITNRNFKSYSSNGELSGGGNQSLGINRKA